MPNMKARVKKVPVTAELCAFVHREQGESESAIQRQLPPSAVETTGFEVTGLFPHHRVRLLEGPERGFWLCLLLMSCCVLRRVEGVLLAYRSGLLRGDEAQREGTCHMELTSPPPSVQWWYGLPFSQQQNHLHSDYPPSPGRSTLLTAIPQGLSRVEGSRFWNWMGMPEAGRIFLDRAGTTSLLAFIQLPGSKMIHHRVQDGKKGCRRGPGSLGANLVEETRMELLYL